VYAADNNVGYNLDNFRVYAQTNPSNQSIYTEIAYASHSKPAGILEQEYFGLKCTGFFVPPGDGFYTMYIKSDDNGKLYLSPNTSIEHAELIAEAPQHTRGRWDYFDSQKSAKLNLQGGKAYYMEVWHYQGCCAWEIGIGGKFHNTTITSTQAYGEHEEQHIQVSSEIRNETHVSSSIIEWCKTSLFA